MKRLNYCLVLSMCTLFWACGESQHDTADPSANKADQIPGSCLTDWSAADSYNMNIMDESGTYRVTNSGARRWVQNSIRAEEGDTVDITVQSKLSAPIVVLIDTLTDTSTECPEVMVDQPSDPAAREAKLHVEGLKEGTYYLAVRGQEGDVTNDEWMVTFDIHHIIPILQFPETGDPELIGDTQVIQAGKNLRVLYDADRLLKNHPECMTRTDYGQYGTVRMGVKLNGDDSTDHYISVSGKTETSYATVPRWGTVRIPEGTTTLELWFQCKATGQAWDSNDGHNYSFEVVP